MVFGINAIAVLAAALGYLVLGALWYSRLFFGGSWTIELRLSEADMTKRRPRGPRGYLLALLGAVASATALEMLVRVAASPLPLLGPPSHLVAIRAGIVIGLVFGVGGVAAVEAPHYAFESRPMRLYLINVGYNVVGFTLMGAILGVLF
jgi:Protein of unknown function (DUF1761)